MNFISQSSQGKIIKEKKCIWFLSKSSRSITYILINIQQQTIYKHRLFAQHYNFSYDTTNHKQNKTIKQIFKINMKQTCKTAVKQMYEMWNKYKTNFFHSQSCAPAHLLFSSPDLPTIFQSFSLPYQVFCQINKHTFIHASSTFIPSNGFNCTRCRLLLWKLLKKMFRHAPEI